MIMTATVYNVRTRKPAIYNLLKDTTCEMMHISLVKITCTVKGICLKSHW